MLVDHGSRRSANPVAGGRCMPRVTYHILVDHDGWYVGLNEKRFGPCKTELLAVGAAVSAAMKATAEGIETEVLVDRPSDNLRRVLTPDVS